MTRGVVISDGGFLYINVPIRMNANERILDPFAVMSKEEMNELVDAALVVLKKEMIAENFFATEELLQEARLERKLHGVKLHFKSAVVRSGDTTVSSGGLTLLCYSIHGS